MTETATVPAPARPKRDVLAELTTEVKPPKQFTVDGEAYDLYGAAHLSDDKEAWLTAIFARHEKLVDALGDAEDDRQATRIAQKLGVKRDELIEALTSVPVATLQEWPLSLKGRLFGIIQKELELENEAEADGGGDG